MTVAPYAVMVPADADGGRTRRAPRAGARASTPAKPRLAANLRQLTAEVTIGSEDGLEGVHLVGASLGRTAAMQVEVVASRLERIDLSGADLPGLVLSDTIVDRGDLANLATRSARLTRSLLRGVRMTGAQIVDSVLSDVVFEEAKLDLAVFRMTKFRRVVFRGCNLTRADFLGADIGGVTFLDCDLAGAQFSQAKAVGARFANCQLDGIGGVASLRGSSMSGDDLVLLTRVFATALGIDVVVGHSAGDK